MFTSIVIIIISIFCSLFYLPSIYSARFNETILKEDQHRGLFVAAKKDASAVMNTDTTGLNLSKFYVSASSITLTQYVETDEDKGKGYHYIGKVLFAETACVLSAWTFAEYRRWTCPTPEPLVSNFQ